MTLRPLLTQALAVLVALALPVLAQTTAPAQTPAQGLVIPPHNCVAPEYPTRSGSQKRGEAYNRTVEAFNRDYKAYGECVRKYVDETKTWIKNIADASNKAIDEFNKFNEEVKKKVEEDKD